jgi:divalent metal cation (Fe/Co/Zn/Cd) transporter
MDFVVKLVVAESPTIQTVGLFSRRVRLGRLMIAAPVYSVIPPLVFGRMQRLLARKLHEKALQTDANINKGDWLPGLVGVPGIRASLPATGGPIPSRRASSRSR